MLEKHIKTPQINVETYLKICEELGQEPDPKKMPIDLADFPVEVQLAFFVYSFLPDRWDGASGTYMGKDWSSCTMVFDLYDVPDRAIVFRFAKKIEALNMLKFHEDAEKKRKADERRAGNKNLTHNVSG